MPTPDSVRSTAAALRASAIKFRTLFECANDGIFVFDGAAVTDCNHHIRELFGLSRDEILGHSIDEWSPPLQPDGTLSVEKMHQLLAAAAAGQPQSFEWQHCKKDGSLFFAEVSLYRIDIPPKRNVIAILRDVTERRRLLEDLQKNNEKLKSAHEELASMYQQLAASEEALAQQVDELKDNSQKLNFTEQRYRLAMDASVDAIWEVDYATDNLTFSTHWMDRFGIPHGTPFQRRTWLALVHPVDLPLITDAFDAYTSSAAPHYDVEYRVRDLNGSYVWVHARGKALRDDNGIVLRVAGSLTDITDRKLQEDKIYHLAYFDALTGLPNRRRLELLLAEKSILDQANGALLFIDLDNFKLINDSSGHACGDALIADVARQLAMAVGSSHILARIGGDEFIVVLTNTNRQAFIQAYAQRLINLFNTPFTCQGHQYYLSASIGIAFFPKDGAGLDDLLRKADTALHVAKATGRSAYRFFEQSMQDSVLEKIALENRLRAAVKTKEHFHMRYQPQIDTKTGRLVGMEALMRWCCPERGMISPLQFIPVAEETGLINELGDWGLRTACRFCRELHDAGHVTLSVSVNVSVKQLLLDNFVESVAAVLVETGLPPSALELEITESVLIQAFETNVEKLEALRAMGIRTALDDFGTGYSSLTYLQQLPIHTLKIDQSFISRIHYEESTRTITATIISLAQQLGISVVAEGVETEEQRELLEAFGCNTIQGYSVSQPLMSGDFRQWLKK
jgi:diguanylate cyclase (GGDEF)-like protein/PAS domain S-box-containing protein